MYTLSGVCGFLLSDVNDCVSAPCAHGGTCQDLVNAFSCTCHSGYTGNTCETGRVKHSSLHNCLAFRQEWKTHRNSDLISK